MSRGRKSIQNKTSNCQSIFYNSVGSYVRMINSQLAKKIKLEPLSNHIRIMGGYAFKSSNYSSEGIPVIRISDFNDEKIVLDNVKFYTKSDDLRKYELHTGDIIIALTGGTIAKLGIVQEGIGRLYLNQRVGKFEVLSPDKFEREYIYWIARSIQNIIKGLAWGAAIPNVSPKQIEKLVFPIPNKNIQRGIIEFLNDLKNNIIEKGKVYFNEKIENTILVIHKNQVKGTLLSTKLTHQLDLVKQLRQAFLREAMQGKLTKEWRIRHPELLSGSQSANTLLAKIKAEKEQLIKEKKIKKQKPFLPISEDKIPFEIPENWVWCRLGEICEKIGSGSTPKGSNYSDNGFPFFRSQNIHDEGLNYDDIKFISNEVHNKMNGTIVYPNDILLNITGGSLGRCALVSSEFQEGNVSQHVCIIRPISIDNSFVHKLIMSPLIQQLIFNSTTGAGREGLPKYNLEQFLIPLPPLSEQKQIVEKLDKLMLYCDQLEESIKASQQQNELLLQQVLREALSPKQKEAESPIIDFKARTCSRPERAIIAGYIINKNLSKDFGRVKLQKLLYLVEHICKLDFQSNYIKKAAGPYDGYLLKDIEEHLKRYRYFDIWQEKREPKRVYYKTLAYASELNDHFGNNFENESERIEIFLKKFKELSWEFCEIVATLYAVWNNRIIKKQTITNHKLKKDFLVWDNQKHKYTDELDKALIWMKSNHIIPDGWGKYI